MIERAKYKKLRKAVQAEIEEQKERDFIAITRGMFSYVSDLSGRDLDGAWPHVCRELGLVDDGTGYDTWTLPGRGIGNAYLGVPTRTE